MSTQHERDSETGFDYRGARFYDAEVGRFLSLDPLASDFVAWSPYNYVLGNPVRLVDPDGRAPGDPKVIHDHNLLAYATRISSSETIVGMTRSSTTTQTYSEGGNTYTTITELASAETASFNDAGEFLPGSFQGVHTTSITELVNGEQVGKPSTTSVSYSDYNNADPVIKSTQNVMKGIHNAGTRGKEADESPGNIVFMGNNSPDNSSSTAKQLSIVGLLSTNPLISKGASLISNSFSTINSMNSKHNLESSTLLLSENFNTGETFQNDGPYGSTQSYKKGGTDGVQSSGALIQQAFEQYKD